MCILNLLKCKENTSKRYIVNLTGFKKITLGNVIHKMLHINGRSYVKKHLISC